MNRNDPAPVHSKETESHRSTLIEHGSVSSVAKVVDQQRRLILATDDFGA